MVCRDENCGVLDLHEAGTCRSFEAEPPAGELTGVKNVRWTLHDVRHHPFLHAKQAAARLGVALAEYLERRAAGQKWCVAHKAWHHCDAFGRDHTRSDGKNPRCRKADCAIKGGRF